MKKYIIERKNWTKEDIKKVLKLWESLTVQELLSELDCTKSQLGYIVSLIKKNGGKLTPKWKKGYIDQLIKDAIKEFHG